MRIKNFTLVLLITALLCCSLKCRKDKEKPPAVLPPITQEGKNTFGCKVDGEVWVPYYKCGGTGNPCGELFTDVTNSIPVTFTIKIGNKKSVSSFFTIETKPGFAIGSVGNKIDSVILNFQSEGGGLYYNYNYYNRLEKFEISKLDAENKIIAGTFEATLYKSVTDSVKITEGRFDLKFQACKCSH